MRRSKRTDDRKEGTRINSLERCKRLLSSAKNSFTGKYHLYTGEKLHWFHVTSRLERSVLSAIFPWVLFCGVYGFLVSLLYYFGFPIAFSQKSGVLTNAVLSFNIGFTLLLVFRTNTAHAKFWEDRQLWGALVNTVRNLTQGIYIVVKNQTPQDRVQKEAILRLVVAFTIQPQECPRHNRRFGDGMNCGQQLRYPQTNQV